MALKITKASDPITVDRLTVCLYGPPGIGKTSTAFTAATPILLDFDHGAHRSGNRGDTVQVSSWGDVEQIDASDLAGYSTVIVDTAGRALDTLTAHLIANNSKFKGYGGALTLQGYGALKSAFTGWLKLLNSFGKDVVLIAHSDEQRNGDDVIERLDVQGGSKNEIYKAVDAMGRLAVSGGKRTLNFDPSSAAYGKNPGRLEPLDVPSFAGGSDFLAGVIDQIKDTLNAESDVMREARERLESVKAEFSEMTTADEFNAKVKKLASAEPDIKALLVKCAQSAGLDFDKKTKTFSERQEAA